MQYRLINTNFKDNYGRSLLQARGVKEIDLFLHPTEACLQNEEYLDNIAAGALLLLGILKEEKPILIIVDSDVDGFTSAAIIYLYITKNFPNAKIDYRLHSGKQHGLEDHIEDLIEEDWGLIICPDSSSNDIEYHDRLNCPILVLDHHEVDQEISDNAIIINNQTSLQYWNKDLTGAGVAFQFCKYLDSFTNNFKADELIDLAALGICGDMGSMLSIENRYICYVGFKNIKNPFFKAILDKQSYSTNGKVNPLTVAFYVVPMINAMIRVGTMEEKTRLFEAFIHGDEKIPSGKRGAKGTLEYRAIESVRECVNARTHQNKILDKNVEKFEDRIAKYGLLDNRILFVRLEDEDDLPAELNGSKLVAR